MQKLLVLVTSLVLTSAAFAGEETGKVRFQHGQFNSSSTSSGFTFLFLDGAAKSGIPSCSTNASGDRWVINNDWPGAKVQMSVLLLAAASGKKVLIRGTGDCSVWGDTETAQDIMIVE